MKQKSTLLVKEMYIELYCACPLNKVKLSIKTFKVNLIRQRAHNCVRALFLNDFIVKSLTCYSVINLKIK